MPLRNARRLVALSVVTTLVVALAACSSTSTKAATPTTAATAATHTTGSTTSAPSAAPAQSAGCGVKPAAAPGQTTIHIQSSGVARDYIRHVPTAYDGAKPMPLVVDVHGYEEGAAIQAAMSGFGPYGDRNGFVTIEPDGLGPVPHWDTSLGSKDLKFIGDALDNVEKTMCIDTTRVYATGLSQGAYMSSAIACEYADRFAAVAPVAGITAIIKGCKPARPVPVISFHGTSDPILSYAGGLGPGALNLPTPDGKGKLKDVKGIKNDTKAPSMPQQFAAWAKRNGCTMTLEQAKITSDVTQLRYPCPRGAEVVFYRVTGGGHTWPGSAFSASPVVAQVTGKTTMTINATALIWAFFKAHHL
jgi:polyhydroxybutyrate depolymerase